MKKLIFYFFLLGTGFLINAQDTEETEEDPDGWKTTGKITLLFNQSAFNAEWTGGGTSNFAGNINLLYDFNYKKGTFSWDTRVLGDYGLTKIKGDEFLRKTNDRLEINSTVGLQIQDSNWYYSFFTNFRTQFDKGFEFGTDEEGNAVRTEITRFMSPGYLQIGPGILWKKSDNLKVNIAPATSRFIFVNSRFTDVGNDQDAIDAFNQNPYFGVEANNTMRFEFGASMSAYAKFDIMDNVSLTHLLNLYSNYLEDPQNIDIDYTMNIDLKVNDFLSANLIFQAIYDDNAVRGFQIREVFGVGFNVTL